MAEDSMLWGTGTTGDGLNPYSQTETINMFRRLLIGDQEASQGVLPDYLNELACSSSLNETIQVATGAAVVYGFQYINDASLGLAVPAPAVGTTGGRVSLRANYAAQTVRATVTKNTDGNSAIPALTQVAGTTWDIPLCTFQITTGGVVTITDARDWCKFSTIFEVVGRRQGGSATNWGATGTNNYSPARQLMQAGAIAWGGAAAASGSVIVTFPTAYAAGVTPLILSAIPSALSGATINCTAQVSNTQITINWRDFTGATYTALDLNWAVVGPE